ncbi:CPBP family intramembrane glutamic endopeptidase [Pseudomonas sp. KNUC1026]|uniref:CPBP family intramembrane glutamic endopeptidase n=1 Tax=Pseudomonas sp. KNUC1026 TaxID=2893890 RepID=UPI002E2EEE52|nr:CPBP family intramembrane glutamic endopeptidase [Pseudomonas sp. KNUC1026]
MLFRGMLQGWLERRMTAWYAAIGSALAFCACHFYLAFILTNAGWPVLVFTLLEGVACALVRLKWGTWPAVLTHGTAILLIGAPLQP